MSTTDIVSTNAGISTTGWSGLSGDYWQPQPYWTWPVIQHQFWHYPNPTPRCAWCQGQHADKCPRLKAVIYRANGTVERVEFFEED